jgi:hypothetical protein
MKPVASACLLVWKLENRKVCVGRQLRSRCRAEPTKSNLKSPLWSVDSFCFGRPHAPPQLPLRSVVVRRFSPMLRIGVRQNSEADRPQNISSSMCVYPGKRKGERSSTTPTLLIVHYGECVTHIGRWLFFQKTQNIMFLQFPVFVKSCNLYRICNLRQRQPTGYGNTLLINRPATTHRSQCKPSYFIIASP